MDTILVSILVPIYNVEQFIERCARSLFEQSYPYLEYVFVNDCTPDKSIEILKNVLNDYPDRKETVIIINHEQNKGLAATRNTGLNKATGEFVCIVDSDDWMEIDAVKKLMERQKEKDSDIVSGNRLVHYKTNDGLWQEKIYHDKEQMVLQMMQMSWDHLITGRIFRRSLFVDNNLKWNEGLDLAEDRYMMTLLAYYSKDFDTVDNVVYHYERRNVNSITNSKKKEIVFRNYNQELCNVLSLKDFFNNKESVYKNACIVQVMKLLEFNMQLALAHSSKKEFQRVVGMIDSYSDDDLNLIDWEKTGLKGWYLHTYILMRFNWLKRKTIRFVKKRLKK